MSHFRALALAVIAALLLAGCTLELPAPVSGTAQPHGKYAPLPTVQLSPAQLSAVSSWFSQRSSGWEHSYASYVPVFEVTLTLANGKTAYINIMKSQIVVNYDESQYVQVFSKPELENLVHLVDQHGG